MNLVKNVKNKWAEHKFKKLKKEVIQLRKETSWISSQQDSSSSADTCKDSTARKHFIAEANDKTESKKDTEKGDDELTKLPSKHSHLSIGHFENRSESVPEETSDLKTERYVDKTKLTSSKRKRTRMRKTKRCHLCRKRGHIKRNCPFGLMLQN